MAESNVNRRLAAILAADVVGYSRLMGEDETGTLECLKSLRREIVQPKITDFNGRIVKLMGDGLLAEFPSVVEAVQCAVDIQQSIAERDCDMADDDRIRLRIGINLGDIIVEGSDIYGDGVNVAARLEGLADTGGVCISDGVRLATGNKLQLDYEFMGEQSVKNIEEPIKTYQIRHQSDERPKVVTPDLAAKPSIAVLPFDNLSSDPDQQFFADGIAEDIITALSKFHDLLVIARNSSFTYRDVSVDVRQVGRELDVRYVLEGSVRAAGNKVRITAQLIEAESGNHVWADRFDRSLEDVFEVQDEITAMVTSTVGQQVRVAEIASSMKRDKNDLKVRDLVARAQWHMDQMSREDFHKAREYSDLALERHPRSVAALGTRAYVNIMEFVYGWGDLPPAELISNASIAAREGVRIDPDDEAARTFLAAVYWLSGNHDAAIEEAETVIRLNPNFAAAIGVLGVVYAYCGANDYHVAVSNLEKAIRLSPNDPWLQFYFSQRGTAEFWMGNYEAAVEWFQKSLQRNPDLPNALRSLAASWALLGELDKAREALKEVFRVEPGYSIEKLTQRVKQAFKHEEDFEHLLKGLRLAGIPEK